MTAPSFCGYIESQQLPPCPNPDQGNGYCNTHNGPAFSVCTGCGNHASHLCFCRAPLCGECIHHPGSGQPGDSGVHGPREDTVDGEFTEPAPPPTPGPQGPAQGDLDKVRSNLTEAVVISLRQSEGLDEQARAAKVVNDLGMATMITLFSGMMSAPPTEGSPG